MLPTAQPKPTPSRRIKARKQRRARKIVQTVRAQCVERDGYCRVAKAAGYSVAVLIFDCNGVSEWAHLGEHKRYKTRGKPPEVRHTTAGSLMLCKRHHRAYDAGELEIVGEDANQSLVFKWVSGTRYRSVT